MRKARKILSLGFQRPFWAIIILTVVLPFAAPAEARETRTCQSLFSVVSESWRVGSAKWRLQFRRVLSRLSAPEASAFTDNDRRILGDLGVGAGEIRGKTWPEVRSVVLRKAGDAARDSAPIAEAVAEYQDGVLSTLPKLMNDAPPAKGEYGPDEVVYGSRKMWEAAWGAFLLAPDDKAFQDPRFLKALLGQRGVTGTGYLENDPQGSYGAFMHQFKRLSRGLDFEVVPVNFTMGGSDANTLVLDVANWIVSLRHGRRMNGRVLFFDESYVAARGPLRQMRHFDRIDAGADSAGAEGVQDKSAPWSDMLIRYRAEESSIKESALAASDLAALESVRQELARGDVGVVMVEPIATSAGVKFFKPEFLRELGKICGQSGVAIVADEAFGAGGRTGAPFSFLQYPGFVPDFVTFGKGVVAAGIADVIRKDGSQRFSVKKIEEQINKDPRRYLLRGERPFKLFDSTVHGWSDVFLKSAQTLKRVLDDNLMARSETMGKLLREEVEWLRYVFASSRNSAGFLRAAPESRPELVRRFIEQDPNRVRGLGLMVAFDSGNETGTIRFTPRLTVSPEDIESFVRNIAINSLLKHDSARGGRFQNEIARLRGLEGEEFKREALKLRLLVEPRENLAIDIF